VATLKVVKPCPESWDEMSGDGRLRHCDGCNKDVHDLRGMSDAEALAYVRARGTASMCVRMLVVTTAVAACGAGAHPPPPAVPPAAPIASQAVAPAEPSSPLDSDKDGVPDAADACPAEPGPVSSDPHKSGCPQFVTIESMGDLIILEQIHFQRGARVLLAESFPMIDETIRALKNTPAIRQIAVEGHASADEPSAQALSEARAKAVVARMVAAGIDPKRLVARGYAASRPIDENKTSEGRARNRRVEFRILDEAEASASRDASCPSGPPGSPAP
jgi:outer membrane protein OmpA-like peptidoglycan-associated protein